MTHSSVGSCGRQETRRSEGLSQQRLASRGATNGPANFRKRKVSIGEVRGDVYQAMKLPRREAFECVASSTTLGDMSIVPVEAISEVSTLCAIAKQKPDVDDVEMSSKTKRPRVGDQVGIAGFLGRFEVVQVALDGAMTDLKHLGIAGPDYIERDILSQELIYLNVRKTDSSANLPREVFLTR